MTSRERIIKKAQHLRALSTAVDHCDNDRKNERVLAKERLETLIKKENLTVEEIETGICLEEDEITRAKSAYGPFYRYILFYSVWDELKDCNVENPYNTLFLEEEEKRFLSDDFEDEVFKAEICQILKTDQLNSKRLKELTYLDISGKGIHSLSGIEKAVNLKWLNIRDNPIESLISLEKNRKLQYLDISDTKVSSINALSNLTYLKYLSARNLKLKSLKPLIALKLLNHLDLRHTECRDKRTVQMLLKRCRTV